MLLGCLVELMLAMGLLVCLSCFRCLVVIVLDFRFGLVFNFCSWYFIVS